MGRTVHGGPAKGGKGKRERRRKTMDQVLRDEIRGPNTRLCGSGELPAPAALQWMCTSIGKPAGRDHAFGSILLEELQGYVMMTPKCMIRARRENAGTIGVEIWRLDRDPADSHR